MRRQFYAGRGEEVPEGLDQGQSGVSRFDRTSPWSWQAHCLGTVG